MFTFVDVPVRFPFKCASCHCGVDRAWYLDLGEDLDSPDEMMPTLYICNLCFTSFAKDKDLVDAKPMLEEIKNLKEELFDSKVKAEALEQMVNAALRVKFINVNDPAVRELVSFLETPISGEEIESRAPGPGERNESGARERMDSGTGETSQPGHDDELAGLHTAFTINGGLGVSE